ncbi:MULTISPECIES: dihydrodipicolinate reductase C-terminal domain-containing protein [Paraburkholderia]|jgi:Dihydrodipicolinate reductase|uniref:dihydrodipicolinate reductase C-terminal domain-containing protein n=1 Tax=Paraburkholderia TaxID=1822464 RepID=UPI00190DBC1A|nr:MULTISPECIES: dihydrodipicolinate reductase C-terminal domain-containing protein [Paraburkholderia]MBK3745116.1 dihydrodipicolinate reductase [Paraburkholderia aspalathi]MBK5186281.1 dihydrodipicolinate reductase [Burkholderia sp. R-69749]CAE6855629.1 4-hydroxy-tetrahydrodipicolinate reductase [Paraburkholderia nemoris]CAE6903121.1 4-hydroxy-tetrahydrodipicolinate reductase [Paraburkholderia domus]
MHIIIVGSGKLATELLSSLKLGDNYQIASWADRKNINATSIVVHAGSGRELSSVIAYCRATASSLIELATGSGIESESHDFPVVLCPNTNVLMLKFMLMLETSSHLFRDYKVSLVESHQASKTSVAGTAVTIAQSIGLTATDIHSVRDPNVQRTELQIPDDQLARHAYHQIRIEADGCKLQLESHVYNESPYADGVSRIIEVVRNHKLDHRCYSVMEFLKNGWL